jgi:hypothetical protein
VDRLIAYCRENNRVSRFFTWQPCWHGVSTAPIGGSLSSNAKFTPVSRAELPGDVTASVRAIPNLGCAATDFAGFSVGSIALITRGTCQPDTNNLHYQQERQESPDKATAKLRE